MQKNIFTLTVYGEKTESAEHVYHAVLDNGRILMARIGMDSNYTRFCNSIMDILLDNNHPILLKMIGCFYYGDEDIIRKIVEVYNNKHMNNEVVTAYANA